MRRLVIATDTGAVFRAISSQLPHLLLELRVGPYVAHDSEFERFLRADDAAGHQQLVGFRDADQPRHRPGAERLGNDAAAHEDETDARAFGGDADVPLHREREPTPTAGPLIAAMIGSFMFHGRICRRADRDRDARAASKVCRRREIRARAECAPRAGDDDHAHASSLSRLGERR